MMRMVVAPWLAASNKLKNQTQGGAARSGSSGQVPSVGEGLF